MSVFFILSCARSGSTSLARILDGASNGSCATEPMPNLNVETRLAMDGRLDDPARVVRELVVPRVEAGVRAHGTYGEKNVTYGPFIGALHAETGCRFVWLTRDGRDVVTSLVNWHESLFGNVYRECRETGELSPDALSAAMRLPVWMDTSDRARPRPRPGDPLHPHWSSLSRAEMCAYYWAFINELYLDALSALPDGSWMRLDYTTATAADVQRVASFCGLEGLDSSAIQAQLDGKINSLADRSASAGRYPSWRDWDGGRRRSFEAIASGTMERLGYWDEASTRWRPPRYGAWWAAHEGGVTWYEWMYDTRRLMHEECMAWVRGRIAAGDAITSIADLGCGVGVGYAEAFADLRYVGVDLTRNVEWCRANRTAPSHAYLDVDFIGAPLAERCDVVMSSGTMDNVYDVDALLRAMVSSSRRWVYLTAYRGWFPDLDEHRYTWSPEHSCFYTDVSPRRLESTLRESGCTEIVIEPRRTSRSDIPYETRVIARVPS